MGNTSKKQTAANQRTTMSQALGAESDNPAAPKGPDRPPRIPLNSGNNLHVDDSLLDRENFAYRWFAQNTIKGGRIESAKGAWWEHVADDRGQNIMRPSGGDQMYLMQIELKYWQEDQKLKRDKARDKMERESAIGEGEYAPTADGRPEGGKSAITRRTTYG